MRRFMIYTDLTDVTIDHAHSFKNDFISFQKVMLRC